MPCEGSCEGVTFCLPNPRKTPPHTPTNPSTIEKREAIGARIPTSLITSGSDVKMDPILSRHKYIAIPLLPMNPTPSTMEEYIAAHALQSGDRRRDVAQ